MKEKCIETWNNRWNADGGMFTDMSRKDQVYQVSVAENQEQINGVEEENEEVEFSIFGVEKKPATSLGLRKQGRFASG